MGSEITTAFTQAQSNISKINTSSSVQYVQLMMTVLNDVVDQQKKVIELKERFDHMLSGVNNGIPDAHTLTDAELVSLVRESVLFGIHALVLHSFNQKLRQHSVELPPSLIEITELAHDVLVSLDWLQTE
jgi:hypothetical protein